MKKKLTSPEFIERHRVRPTDFTRERSLPFHKVFLVLINFLTKSLQADLDNIFKVLLNKEIPVNEVTKSAFCLARKKLGHEAFLELDKDQIETFYQTGHNRWNGFRLIGVDGSTARLPVSKEIQTEYGVHDTSETGTPLTYARLSQAYDLLNNLTLDAILSTYDDNEHNLALRHTAVFKPDDLVICDRNYAPFWMFALLNSKNVDFCFRLKVGSWKTASSLTDSGEQQTIAEIYPSKQSSKKCLELGISKAPLKLRFICITLITGEKEVLITSLTDLEKYPYSLFSRLYQLRWQVEESYKTIKSRLEMENFSGKSCLSIKQDFHAKIFSCNLTAILVGGAEELAEKKCENRKKPYKINFTQALNRMKNSIVLLLYREKETAGIYLDELVLLFSANLEPIRKERNFQRNFRKSKRIYPMPYKNSF
ncbi:IS4 family transposase [Anditalea andensis]|uniref:Transposase IS4-like domain-containing protein n=1 Tax=Anditalea andensis TaxID=1048983 RepID=A0A074LDF0_9BACT|nr:IS4 family transposase [Anditalea andensis]KEO71817.1 hypothetical protein EL17_21795 [Anditalea andensis]